MTRRSNQSIAATPEGLQLANLALKKVCSGKKTILKDFAQVSRARVQDFFAGKQIGIETFQAICKALEIEDWQNIASLTKTIDPQPEQRSQEGDLDIDALMREVRSRCCEAILDSYSKIRLPDDTRIDVDLLYVDVYVLEKLSGKRFASISGLLEGIEQREDYERLALGQRQKRLPGQEIVKEFPRLMVLGKPGSGKTTFLRHLAVDCSKGKFFGDRIPVLIEMRSIKEGNSFNLLNLIHRAFGLTQQEQTLQILNQGKAFILLDGLDEVPSQLRQSVRDQIYEFAKEYRKNRFVLTCRTQTIEYIADHFEPIEVANFDAEQVETFARNWFSSIPETSGEAERWTSRFVGKLEENKQIRELAVTPILLALTCLLFTAEQDLPTKRSQLYEKGSNLLLKQWDKFREIPRDYQQLSVSDKQKLLSYLVFRKFEHPDNFILFEQDEIQGYIAEHLGIKPEESEALLEAIEAHHGLLIERANGIWSFSHLTFQEYFAAKHVVDNLAPEAEFQSLVTHITEPRWREVFLLTVEMLNSTDDLLQLMKAQIDGLLAGNEKLQQFLRWVDEKAKSVNPIHKQAYTRAIYFSLAKDCNSNHQPYDSSTLSQQHGQSLPFSLTFDLALNGIFFEFYTNYALAVTGIGTTAFDLELSIYFDNEFNQGNRIILKRNNADKDTGLCFEVYSSLKAEWQSLLQNLFDQLPLFTEEIYEKDALDDEPVKHNIVSLDLMNQWWQENGQTWTEQLRALMIEHRNIGHDWQFSDAQQQLLQQYYDANKLLVDCLNSDCYVSREVRQEIEETLLLPNAEIQKRH